MRTILKKLKDTNKLKQITLISVISAFGFILLFARVYKTGSIHFTFLIWNLFLALIPWVISTVLMLYPQFRKRLSVMIISGFAWLLFIPNSFYILTDLFHLNYRNLAPIWYDLVLIFSFAWAGIMLGFSTLQDAEMILAEKINKKLIPFFSFTILFLISFGIYLGRELRWNSWNIINEPAGLLHDIKIRITDPFDHPGTWGMTVLIGILLNLIWWSFKLFRNNQFIHQIKNTTL